MFFGSPPPPPPPTGFAVAPPSGSLYGIGLLFVIVSQLITVPLCVAAFKLKASAPALIVLGVITATLPLYVQPWLSEYLQEAGYASAHDVLLGRFVGSTTYAFVALRFFGAAVGGTPKGADVDVATWITFATAACDPQFDKVTGKPLRPPAGAVPQRFGMVLLRMAGMCLVSTIAQPHGSYPFKAYVAEQGLAQMPFGYAAFAADHVLVHLMLIWLFLSLLMDIGSILLLVQDFHPIDPFDNPMFTTGSPRGFWGRKWNLQVNQSFKRCVFVPLRKAGVGGTLAALLTFISSGLFHEYQARSFHGLPWPSMAFSCLL